jgi:putative oxygen-independent coproporphyrinogen III oxidase
VTHPPLALYVHLPWCVRKCPYCDFNSYALKGALPEAQYVEALQRDLASQAEAASDRPIVSLFFGGGTPSLFSPAGIGRIIEIARARLSFAPDAEITLEANPGTIERGRFTEYRAAGVNRVSLGAQSFDAAQLAALGRIHSPADTSRAVEELHAAGLENFNLDLMYALPGQEIAGAAADVDAALALSPAHLSHYQLTLEPGTAFAAHPPSLPDDDLAAQMLDVCQERLAVHGFSRYEVSAYALPRRQCRHNVNYWRFGDYLGIGAGAHGKITDVRARRVMRTWQTREPRRYLSQAPGSLSSRTVTPEELPFEFMMNALRLLEGFETADFCERTHLPWAAVVETLASLRARGLMSVDGRRWQPTPLGMRFLNDLVAAFLPDSPAYRGPSPSSAPSIFYAQPPRGVTTNERITAESGQAAE